MSSVSRLLGILLVAWASVAGARAPLRVCADPNNMPFSNSRGEGFENRIAALVAQDMHRTLTYFWFPQRRGFVGHTLNEGKCDLIMGVPAAYGLLQPTRSYYRSSYVFVSRRDRGLHIDSFDAPALRTLKIGIQIAGDDYDNPPAAQALAARGLAEHVRGFTLYGDYSKADPQREIIDAVAERRVDVAVVWGPLAGYYGRRASTLLDITPIGVDTDGPTRPLSFDIAMGVRRDDGALRQAVDAIIERHQLAIHRILESYGVPLR